MATLNQVQSQHGVAPYALEQFVAEELGNSSYLVADAASGKAVVIDPWRDADQYVDRARARGWDLTYALDTHVHNDFLSGGFQLSAGGYARFLRPAGDSDSAAQIAAGDELALGALRLRALHTPGHTAEHLSYQLLDREDRVHALFSGGALMVGAIARPDLQGADHTFALALMALQTVRDVFEPMNDGVKVFPTHGGGSFCGAGESGERTTTIGTERRSNPLFNCPDFLEFLATYANQGEFPDYYREMAPRNRAGPVLLRLPFPPLLTLDPEAVKAMVDGGVWLVDIRSHELFDQGFIPGSLSLGVSGPLSAWLGWIMPIDRRVILVAATRDDAELARRMLVRIGVDAVEGWVPFASWTGNGRSVQRMRRGTMAELAGRMARGDRLAVVDVRQEREWAGGHLPGAVHALPPQLLEAVSRLPDETLVAVHCSSGYRSALAASMLAREGRLSPWHIADGIEAWRALGHPLTIPG